MRNYRVILFGSSKLMFQQNVTAFCFGLMVLLLLLLLLLFNLTLLNCTTFIGLTIIDELVLGVYMLFVLP